MNFLSPKKGGTYLRGEGGGGGLIEDLRYLLLPFYFFYFCVYY